MTRRPDQKRERNSGSDPGALPMSMPGARRNARLMLLLALVMMASMVLTACGGGGGDDDDDADEPTATAATGATTPSAAAGGSTATSGTETEAATPAATDTTGAATATTPAGVSESTATTAAPEATGTSAPTSPAATATATGVATLPPADPNAFAYGFNVAWRGDAQAADFNIQAAQMVTEAGFGWVRLQIYWRDVQREPEWWDPLPIDLLLDEYASQGVRVMANISNPPDWALDPTGNAMLADFGQWKTFVSFLSQRYKGKIHAYQIWNEQNLASTVKGTVRVSDYAQLLKNGYEGVKEHDPDALVVFGGLTPTGVVDPSIAISDVQYLNDFYALDGGAYVDYFDILGMHANATNHPPELLYPDNPGEGNWSQDSSFYFRRAEELRAVMEENGDTRPVWISEFGWTTANEAPGYEYGADNTEEEQAQFLVDAFAWAQTNWEWCTGMFVWNLNFSVMAEPSDEKYPWSVLYHDWSPRPAYTALQEMDKSE